MFRYKVGCGTEDTLHIRKVDDDFFRIGSALYRQDACQNADIMMAGTVAKRSYDTIARIEADDTDHLLTAGYSFMRPPILLPLPRDRLPSQTASPAAHVRHPLG
jgi:hypothetical protein